jgi:uncharacterized repeat protein (TIGR03803 family)
MRIFPLILILCGIILAGCSRATGGSPPLPGALPIGDASASAATQRSESPFARHPHTTFTLLKSFAGTPDGANPHAGMVVAIANGGLYGTTLFGGTNNDGTVFQMNAAGVSVLYSFSGPDGAQPVAGLVRVGSNLYGTTQFGGTISNCGSSSGCGTIFMVTPAGAEVVLHNFMGSACNPPDGSLPYGGLVAINGVLYGTTSHGGAGNKGTVFKLSTSGSGYSVIHSFTNSPDGATPYSGLVACGPNQICGTTFYGGTSNNGTAFRMSRTNGSESGAGRWIHSFAGTPDGAHPQGGVLFTGGALYGTTTQGGTSGDGTVFSAILSSGAPVWSPRSFTGNPDGRYPAANLFVDTFVPYVGLYGTTYRGGTSDAGTVFKISTSGTGETPIHSFAGGIADGAEPEGGMVLFDNPGTPHGHTLYSTTQLGGASNSGTVYQLLLP